LKYLAAEHIVLIHSMLIDETGGSHGIRDQDAILNLEALPRQKFSGKELYPSIFIKAAIYTRNIIFDHPFIDGNKRTAITAASVFLEDNGYKITAQRGRVEKFTLQVIHKKFDLKEISSWLKNNSKKIRRK